MAFGTTTKSLTKSGNHKSCRLVVAEGTDRRSTGGVSEAEAPDNAPGKMGLPDGDQQSTRDVGST